MDLTLETCVLLLINSSKSQLDGIWGNHLKARLQSWNFKFSDDELIDILEVYLEKDFIKIHSSIDKFPLNSLYYTTKKGQALYDNTLIDFSL
jgi:hypothetical protein